MTDPIRRLPTSDELIAAIAPDEVAPLERERHSGKEDVCHCRAYMDSAEAWARWYGQTEYPQCDDSEAAFAAGVRAAEALAKLDK